MKITRFRKEQVGFERWLKTLGYSESVVYGYPRMLNEFFLSIEEHGVTDVRDIGLTNMQCFIQAFSQRRNKRRSGGVSAAHVNKHIDAINKFMAYLNACGWHDKDLKLKPKKVVRSTDQVVLTKGQIEQLYMATGNDELGMRDRAMLAVYYGCGLRKSEGLRLNCSDINFQTKRLHVVTSKNGQSRYVPISSRCLKDLEAYIDHGREIMIADNHPTDRLFISQNGDAVHPETMRYSLKRLQVRCKDLEGLHFGLHSLRHSIATHLMEAGMGIENIALFLGHRCLDSTQIYTHIVHRHKAPKTS